MSRWCCHYACTKDIVDHVLFILENDEAEDYDALWEEVLYHFPQSLPSSYILSLWEDIHRCLTGDFSKRLDFDKGEYPLRLCIHGGARLRDSGMSVTLVHAEEIANLCQAMKSIKRDWMREKLLRLKTAGVSGFREREMSEDEVGEVWREFQELLAFYRQAEKLRLPVICTISH
jgi:hypothetical protein